MKPTARQCSYKDGNRNIPVTVIAELLPEWTCGGGNGITHFYNLKKVHDGEKFTHTMQRVIIKMNSRVNTCIKYAVQQNAHGGPKI